MKIEQEEIAIKEKWSKVKKGNEILGWKSQIYRHLVGRDQVCTQIKSA